MNIRTLVSSVLVLSTIFTAACSDSIVAPADSPVAAFARNPSGSPDKNKSCDSGNGTRSSKNSKNQCSTTPSFTLSFDAQDEGLVNATYNPCPQEPFLFSGYGGETIEVCDFGGDLNLILEGLTGYTVTTAPTGACQDSGGGTWYCGITASNTVITVAAIGAGSLEFKRQSQEPVYNVPKNSLWTWKGTQ